MRKYTGIDKVEDSVDLLLVEEVDGEKVNMSKVNIGSRDPRLPTADEASSREDGAAN